MSQLGSAYLASFRQVEPFDSSRVRSSDFTAALTAANAANALAQSTAFNTGIKEAGANQRLDKELDYYEKRDREQFRRSRAVGLAEAFQAFGGMGGNRGVDSGLAAMVSRSNPALDPLTSMQNAFNFTSNSNQIIRDSSRRSSAVTAEMIRQAYGGQ